MAAVTTATHVSHGSCKRLSWAITSHTDGTAVSDYVDINGEIIGCGVYFGGTAPSADWDLLVQNSYGEDLLYGLGTDIGQAAANTYPTLTAAIPRLGCATGDGLRINCSNMGNTKTATVTLWYR